MVTGNQKKYAVKINFFYFSYVNETGNQFGVQRKAKPAENTHWSGRNVVSLISYSATPRVFRRICLGAEHKIDFHDSSYARLEWRQSRSRKGMEREGAEPRKAGDAEA